MGSLVSAVIAAGVPAHRVSEVVEGLASPPHPVDDLRLWGYAPGGYFFKCVDCHPDEPHAIGDKRAIRCEEHAKAKRDAAYERSMGRVNDHQVAEMEAARGAFTRTASGTKFYPLDPRPEDIFIDDIAAALSKLCRFNGNPLDDVFYSVAEHSYQTSFLVPEEDAMEALLHDASEYITGDLIRPIKTIPAVAAVYKPIEAKIEAAIAERFQLRDPMPASVKKADEELCNLELETFIAGGVKGNRTPSEIQRIGTPNFKLACWEPPMARVMFMGRFWQLAAYRYSSHLIRHRAFLSPRALVKGQTPL